MNRDMLKAGLEKFSELTMDPSVFSYRHDTPGQDGRRHSTPLMWHEVAAAALARIEALEQAEWFVKLPDHPQWRAIDEARQDAHKAERATQRLQQLNDRQAEAIRRLQKELDAANQALRV